MNAAWQDKQWALFQEFKAKLKCNRCGQTHIATLQFHHTDPAKKEAAISNAASRWSHERLLKEIAKCEVLCANCHAIEHFRLKAEVA